MVAQTSRDRGAADHRELRAHWPLDPDDKGKVGQFFALQDLRGAAFRRWHQEKVAAILADVRANPETALKPHPGRSLADVLQEMEATVTSDTYRLTRMLTLVGSVGVVFASMHWTLVAFNRRHLATSDHPVVVWPFGAGANRQPCANDLDAGVTETIEVFAPIGPAQLLLMTWRDEKSLATPVVGKGRHLSTANAFVVANADTQWFHEPDVDPWMARGPRRPLGAELFAGYGLSEARTSQRRAKALTRIIQ